MKNNEWLPLSMKIQCGGRFFVAHLLYIGCYIVNKDKEI